MPVNVQLVGWDHDPRYETERQRVYKHIEEVAKENGYVRAVTEDIMIRARYRLFGLHITVKFQKSEWITDKNSKYVLARLYFDGNADLADKDPNPQWMGEIYSSE
ncbi:MAG: hypothetical protein Q9214_002062, partial [Letrouitia sp. 1 TL-2023]